MNLIQTLLNEQFDHLADEAKPILDALNDKQTTRFEEIVQKLTSALERKQVWNVDYNDWKGMLSNLAETALRMTEGSLPRPITFALYMADFSTYFSWNSAKKQASLLEKFRETVGKSKIVYDRDKVEHHVTEDEMKKLDQLLLIAKAMFKFKEAFDALKPHVQKGRKPNENVDPNAFRRQLGSEASIKLVKDSISAGVKEQLDEYETAIRKFFEGILNGLKSKKQCSDDELEPIQVQVLQRCFTYEQSHEKRGKTYVRIFNNLKPNDAFAGYADKEAKEMRTSIEQRFLHKNVQKLSHIVELKGNLVAINKMPAKPVHISHQAGVIEAGFHYTFADGSEFVVVNKVVFKYSMRGQPFEQFPTTFHDVKLPDGSQLKTPSEEKMVKEFAVAKKPEADE